MARKRNPFGKKGDFFSEWEKKKTPVDDLSRFTVDHDRYDRQDTQKLLEEMKEFAGFRDKLADSKAGDLAYDVWQDLLLSFRKVDPELIPEEAVRPTHLISRMVMEEAQKLPDHAELRQWTQGDDIGSALACNSIEPDVETLYDRMEEEIKQAQELMETMQALGAAGEDQADAEGMFKAWVEGGGDPDDEKDREAIDWSEKMKELQEKIDQLREQAKAQGQSLQEALDKQRPDVRAAMKAALGQAAQDMENQANAAQSWGLEPGELQRLPAAERLELARKFNTPKFKKIAEIFGAMKRMAMTEQRRKVNYAPEEIYDVELGNDIQRVLPAELVKLMDDDSELLFLRDWAEKKLPQYKMRGFDKVAKGGIIYCHDGSGSMSGEPEVWAKAVGLCLLHIARTQKRSFWGIQFGSPGQIRVDDFHDPMNINPDTVLDFAEFFFAGGTDFMTPLNKAVELLSAEHAATGTVKSDIVFASDGMCGITDEWYDNFKKEQERLGFSVWGINIGGRAGDEPMTKICDNKVSTIKSLQSGEDVRSIFGGV